MEVNIFKMEILDCEELTNVSLEYPSLNLIASTVPSTNLLAIKSDGVVASTPYSRDELLFNLLSDEFDGLFVAFKDPTAEYKSLYAFESDGIAEYKSLFVLESDGMAYDFSDRDFVPELDIEIVFLEFSLLAEEETIV